MRVAIFSESYPPLINGVSTSILTLVAQLEQAGHSVFVFTSRFPGHEDEQENIFRFPSVPAIVDHHYRIPMTVSPRISRIIPTLGLDIIHSHIPFLLGLYARRVARQLDLPLVSTNHTLYTEYAHYYPLLPPPMTRRKLVRHMRWYYNECDWVMAPSEMTRQRLIERYGVRTPVSVVPTGIPAPPYVLTKPADVKRELGIPAEGRLLLFVGRLAPEKNLEMLLRAFAQVAERREDAYLVIAGSGKSEGALRHMARRLGPASRIIFTGFLGRTKLDPLYQAADAFLFPSKTETQGLAIGEALAAGTPCVVVNAGGAPESIQNGKNGFLVEDDPRQMAERTLRLLDDPALRGRMAQAAREWAAGMTPDQIAGRVIAVYSNLIRTRTDGPRVTGGGAGTTPESAVPHDT